jgi:hypothetical protein
MPALLEPPTEAGFVTPEPEFFNGNKVMLTLGVVPLVDPRNVMSGRTLHTKEKLCPSSKSNSAEEM